MARRWLCIALATFVLAGLALGAYLWETSLVGSLHEFEGALPLGLPSDNENAAQNVTTPLTSRVVIIIVSGLRSDVASAMPTLQRLSEQGVTTTALAVTPTYAQATWTALLTGARPEIAGGDLLADAADDLQTVDIDHFVGAIRSAGHVVALVGHRELNRLIGPAYRDATTVVFGEGLEGDREVIDIGISLLAENAPQLVLLQLDGVRLASQEHGALSDEALLAATHSDALLANLVEASDLATTCLIVTSDHGILENGGYGGDEEDVVRTPLVMAGQGIKRTTMGDVSQTCIAPTVTSLLGVSPPVLSQGNALLGALDADVQTSDALLATQTAQGLKVAESYLASLGADAQTIAADTPADDTTRFSALTERASQLRAQQLSSRRLNRAPLALLVILLPWFAILRHPSRRTWYLLLAASFVVLAFHGQFQQVAGGYSFSRIAGIDSFVQDTVRQVLVGVFLGTLLAVVIMVLDGQRSPLDLWEGLLHMGLMVAYLLVAVLAVTFALVGIRAASIVPDLTALFVQIQTLLHIALAGALLVLLPVLTAGLAFGAKNLGSLSRYVLNKARAVSEAFHAHRHNR